jgi:hypothetical protein
MVKRVLAASVAVALALVFAAPSHADSEMDATFLKGLDTGQIPYHEGPDVAVLLGHLVCMRLSSGTDTYPATFDFLRGARPAWTDYQHGYFIALAVAAYCPDQKPELPLNS